MIIVNAILVGVTADVELRSALDFYSSGATSNETLITTLYGFEVAMTAIFLLEFLARTLVFQPGLFLRWFPMTSSNEGSGTQDKQQTKRKASILLHP